MLIPVLALLALTEAAHIPFKRFPTPSRRQYSNATYTQHICDPQVTDITISPDQRWTNADTEDAWTAGVNYFKKNCRPKNIAFASCLSNFFGGPDGYKCQETTTGSCSTQVGCKDVHYDAAYLILNSFTIINSAQEAINQATVNANVQMLDNIDGFSSTFSPQTDDSDLLLELINAFSLIVGIGSAGIWNQVFTKISWFASQSAWRGVAKDSANALVTYSAAEGRAHIPPQSAVTGELRAALGKLSSAIEDSATSFAFDIFDGQDDSIDQLHTMITGGSLIDASASPGDFQDTQYAAQRILYAQMVPLGWSKDKDAGAPFVLSVSGDCTPGQPVPCSADIADRGFGDAECENAGVCIEGNKILYVAGLTTGGVGEDITWGLTTLPGGDHGTLDGDKNTWGGLLLEDLAQSSWDGYNANGGKNGFQPSLDNNNGDDLLFQSGPATPGFIPIPLCTTHDLDCAVVPGIDGCKSVDDMQPAVNPYYPCGTTTDG